MKIEAGEKKVETAGISPERPAEMTFELSNAVIL